MMAMIKERPDEAAIQIEIRDNILNNLELAIYVSDLATNEILYTNLAMRKMHGDRPLAGRICWEALHSKSKRCEFCPILYLLKHPGMEYQRESCNGYHEKTCSRIIPWTNGKLAHLQYVIDVSQYYL